MLENWGTSREKARQLRLEQCPSEALSAPIRMASNRREAMEYLKEITPNTFTSLSGLPARLTGRSLGNLVSSAAVASSFCPEAHYFAAANIDKLYPFAIEPWKFELTQIRTITD